MAKARKAETATTRKRSQKAIPTPGFRQASGRIFGRLNTTRLAYLSRRPHRSFVLTRARDAKRSLELPGYWAFTFSVLAILRRRRWLFVRLALVYTLAGAIMVGLSSQDVYAQLSQLIDETSTDLLGDGWGQLGQAGLLLLTGISGGLSPQLTEVQQVYAVFLLLLTWLTAVWLLRAIVAGKQPKLRDGLYNAGAPIVATGILTLVLFIQLLPAALGFVVVGSAISSGLFDTGFIAMTISLGAGLLVVASAYWSTATLFALVVVTLPGMYPWRALVAAGDMVVGRRLRLLLRMIWMTAAGVLSWVIVVLAAIFIVRLISPAVPMIDAVPLVPLVMAIMSAAMVVWFAAYVYLLYRKVVEDDAKPA